VTPFARGLAVLVGLVGLLVAIPALVRELVLATSYGTAWPLTDSWARLTQDPTTATKVAAAATAVAAVALLVLAVRQLSTRRRGPQVVEFGDAAGRARLDVAALETSLLRRLAKELPGVTPIGLDLDEEAGGWRVRLQADVAARDLAGMPARVARVLAPDMERMAGLRLDAVDVVVRRLLKDLPGQTKKIRE